MSRVLIGSVICVAMLSAASAQQLRDVGWDDPFFAPYIPNALPAPRSSNVTGAGDRPKILFKLPVLGLPGVGEFAPAMERSQPLRQAVSSWPQCAAATPRISTVPDNPAQAAGLEPGTWYVRTFDFGCVEIVVEGDRNQPDPAGAPEETPGTQESGTVVITYVDENASTEIDAEGETRPSLPNQLAPEPDKGTPVIGYVRGNLTYSLTIVCSQPDSQAFCNDEQGLKQLVRQFTVVGGLPQ